jgi:cyclic dehypoxanthinyl futalosine synthase
MMLNRHHRECGALDRAVGGQRLSREEVLALYDAPGPELMAAAHEMRLRRTNPNIATYAIGGNIDYTNVCVVACKFCVFYRAKHQGGSFTLSFDEIDHQMREIRRIGGGDVLIQGGVNPDLPFEWYLELLRFLKADYPEIHIDALSPEEVLGLETITGRDASELLADLKEAGLDGMPGAAAEILVDEVRDRIAPTRIKTRDWFRIIDAAQQLRLFNPWVSMVTGFGETASDRVDHLLALRGQQDKAMSLYGSGFAAFKVWPARLAPTRLNGKVQSPSPDETANEYLREVAIARLALDNIINHRAVWRTMGFGVAGKALRSGANDLCGTGSINAINAVILATGKPLSEPAQPLIRQVERCIADAGFVPALRDPSYRIISVSVAQPYPNG